MLNRIPGDYPRPQFFRPDWENLNGSWQFAFDDEDIGKTGRWYSEFPEHRKITVPFCYETKASGIGDESFHPVVWYHRLIHPKENGKRVILWFEGSDYHTVVWINGQMAGEHLGGYTRFGFDITGLLTDGENALTVRVEDSNDKMQPRGKQRWVNENFGCWYIQTTGIWKTVWLEYLPEAYIEHVKMTPRLAERSLDVEWKILARDYLGLQIKIDISFDGFPINSVVTPVYDKRGSVCIPVSSLGTGPWEIQKWSPSTPNLYEINFELLRSGQTVDHTESYFGMREVSIHGGQVLLNGEPVYQRLLLDQGYWPDSHLTPPNEAAIIEDIDKTMAMGFNGVRKHQKIEDGRFAYWCDRKGLLMWCEMPSPYNFGDDMVKNMTKEWMEVVEQHYNHPSIITWTPFNESWGVPEIKTYKPQQHFTEAIYYLTKSMDPMRPVAVNDGWEHTVTDILTLHDYEELASDFFSRYSQSKDGILGGGFAHNKRKTALAQGYEYRGQPIILSEYGGAAFTGGGEKSWGYGNTVKTVEEYLARIEGMTDAIKKLKWICGYCYTQTTDVQQEINGLLDANRAFKAPPEEIEAINLKGI